MSYHDDEPRQTGIPPAPWGDDEPTDDGPLPWGIYALCAGIITGLLAGNLWPI